MNLKSIFVPIALIGCASPAIEFSNAERSVVENNGLLYTVYKSGDRFQVIRTGYANLDRREQVESEMRGAVLSVTDCMILEQGFKGDDSIRQGRLACHLAPKP